MCPRLAHHIGYHEEDDLKRQPFGFWLDKLLIQQGEGYIGRSMAPGSNAAPTPMDTSEPPASPLFRNDERPDTTERQVHLRQLRKLALLLKDLETYALFSTDQDWSHRYARLRGKIESVIVAHRARLLLTPVGQDVSGDA